MVAKGLGAAASFRGRGGYVRSDLFERRQQLMEDWAAYLHGEHGSDHEARH